MDPKILLILIINPGPKLEKFQLVPSADEGHPFLGLGVQEDERACVEASVVPLRNFQLGGGSVRSSC